MVHLCSWSKRVRDWVQTLLKPSYTCRLGDDSYLIGQFSIEFQKTQNQSIRCNQSEKKGLHHHLLNA